MSSTTSFSATLSSASSASPSATQTQGSSGGNDPNQANTFYKNLFYILIGLLCAFGLVSFISLIRARRRRRAIVREARRLGLIVPGMDDYIPFRERQDLKKHKHLGNSLPNWWEIGSSAWVRQPPNGPSGGSGPSAQFFNPARDLSAAAAGGGGRSMPLSGLPNDLGEAQDFRPLAVVAPRPEAPKPEDKPVSELPFFPNHLAYQPESLLPLKPTFPTEDPNAIQKLAGKHVKVAVLLKMPTMEKSGEAEENEEVLREWEGVQLGIASVPVDPY